MSNEVYGEAGKNLFSIPNTVGQFSTTVNKQTGVTQLFIQGPFLTQQSVGTYNPSTGKFTPQADSSITQQELTKITSQEGLNTIKNAAIQTATKDGAPNASQLISKNTSTSTDSGDSSGGVSSEDITKDLGNLQKNTREDKQYQDVVYPLDLKLTKQDCIKFSIIKYIPPGLRPGGLGPGSRIVTLDNSNPIIRKSRLATITLPIPSGITDRNPVDWQSDSIGELGRALSNVSIESIKNGFVSGAQVAGGELNNAMSNSTDLTNTITAKLAEAAVGSSNLISRQFGAVLNPNLELLFNGPSLRSFTFNFRFTPRQKKEAEAVRKIIRQFKQAMSVKRSSSSLLLKAPHTFAISYLSNNENHPYLNRFKECALTDCSVNYTPDGTYMTYDDSSMTAYELSLTFQEIEPIFDDDYGFIDNNADTSIGF
jgi:hypothetical protein